MHHGTARIHKSGMQEAQNLHVHFARAVKDIVAVQV
jgi:hypothetical protein